MNGYDAEQLRALLPFPKQSANKYSRGKLTLFAGSSTYPGAAVLAASAAQRAGAGYTEVYSATSVVSLIQSRHPSLVVRSFEDAQSNHFASSTPQRPCAYVVGPGFDAYNDEASLVLTCRVLENAQAPVLIDGGALTYVASLHGHALCKERFLKDHLTIVTPHAGEAQRLAKVFDIAVDDPVKLACMLSLAYGVITVLKGPKTFVSDGEQVFTIEGATSALAKAGTGDVLSGIIGAFMAQGLSGLDAAVLGVIVHSEAGFLAAETYTSISVIAEDVVEYIPAAIKSIISLKTSLQPQGNDISLSFNR